MSGNNNVQSTFIILYVLCTLLFPGHEKLLSSSSSSLLLNVDYDYHVAAPIHLSDRPSPISEGLT